MCEFVARQVRQEREESDRRVLAANRSRIEREARMLIAEQAKLNRPLATALDLG